MRIQIVIIILTVFILTSCDNREDFYKDLNKAPLITLNKEVKNGILKDTIKISKENLYKIEYTISNESTPVKLGYEVQTSLTGVQVNETTQTIILTITNGQNVVDLIAKDKYGVETKITVNIEGFVNQKPVCKFEADQVGGYDPYQVLINCEQSFDNDAKFGGEIISYHYIINNSFECEVPLEKINFIFPAPGTYSLKCRVRDNDSAYSDFVIKNIEIN